MYTRSPIRSAVHIYYGGNFMFCFKFVSVKFVNTLFVNKTYRARCIGSRTRSSKEGSSSPMCKSPTITIGLFQKSMHDETDMKD